MSYLKFDKAQLVNLEYSLNREILRTNRAGSYALTTLVGCNTRKYHGLLVCPLEYFGGEHHVLLSGVDETIIQHDQAFNIGIRKYKGDHFEPKGHKYIRDFEADMLPVITFRVGGVVLTRERVLAERQEQIMIKYTLLEAQSSTMLKLQPFLAFRENHRLSKSNLYANTRAEGAKNGLKFRLYEGYPYLHIQCSKPAEFVPVPDWYFNVEYLREQERGYDFREDLYVPGYFEVPIRKGESIILSASTSEINPAGLKQKFIRESKKRIPRNNFKNCLLNSAQQFFIHRKDELDIIAGYPWFGVWGRDTFIALPGLTLALGHPDACRRVLDSQVKKMKGGLFPNIEGSSGHAFNSVDAPLWFIWAVQQYAAHVKSPDDVWSRYHKYILEILTAYRDGTEYNIRMEHNGLIRAGQEGKALTWMDAVVHDGPVTPRIGMNVEINALWYNAIMFYLDLAEQAGHFDQVAEWADLPGKIAESFLAEFWDDDKEYLADTINGDDKDWSIRPNQVFAVSLPFSPLTNEIKKAVLDILENELLTPRGLRTLSPRNPEYKGVYQGTQEERDRAYHQGTVWPWLFGHFAEGYLKLFRKSGIARIRKLLDGFEEEMVNDGIGSISEIYDGDPPHHGRGAISQAWSVAEILRVMQLLDQYQNAPEKVKS
jgi:predicted glycogen debranching enzyme